MDVEDLICLGDMCAFDSQREGEDWEGWSRWCGIFTRQEWDVLGYMRDVERYYEVGQGSVCLIPLPLALTFTIRAIPVGQC